MEECNLLLITVLANISVGKPTEKEKKIADFLSVLLCDCRKAKIFGQKKYALMSPKQAHSEK